MSPPGYDPARMMGCLFTIIALVFASIALLAGVTGFLAGATEGQEEIVRGLWTRAVFSVLFSIIAIFAAGRIYRGGRGT